MQLAENGRTVLLDEDRDDVPAVVRELAHGRSPPRPAGLICPRHSGHEPLVLRPSRFSGHASQLVPEPCHPAAVPPLRESINQARLRRSLPAPGMRRQTRELAGVSQTAVSEALGVARATVSRWETGVRTPRGDLLKRYVGLLRTLAAECPMSSENENPAGRPGLAEKPARRGRRATG